jgi:hypothetical protein
MTPSEEFADIFFNVRLSEFESELDQLIEIALITENGSYDSARDRDHLIYIRHSLRRVLVTANLIAEKQRQRFKRKAELRVREDNAHKPSAFTEPENSAGTPNGVF